VHSLHRCDVQTEIVRLFALSKCIRKYVGGFTSADFDIEAYKLATNSSQRDVSYDSVYALMSCSISVTTTPYAINSTILITYLRFLVRQMSFLPCSFG